MHVAQCRCLRRLRLGGDRNSQYRFLERGNRGSNDNTRMQQTAWRVIRYLPRRCRGDHTGLRGGSQSWFCWHGPQLIRMLCRVCTYLPVGPRGRLRSEACCAGRGCADEPVARFHGGGASAWSVLGAAFRPPSPTSREHPSGRHFHPYWTEPEPK